MTSRPISIAASASSRWSSKIARVSRSSGSPPTNPWGPLSGAMMALSLPMAARTALRDRCVHRQHALHLRFRGGEARRRSPRALGTFDAYRLVPAVDYESDGKLSESATDIVIWVSADDRRLAVARRIAGVHRNGSRRPDRGQRLKQRLTLHLPRPIELWDRDGIGSTSRWRRNWNSFTTARVRGPISHSPKSRRSPSVITRI